MAVHTHADTEVTRTSNTVTSPDTYLNPAPCTARGCDATAHYNHYCDTHFFDGDNSNDYDTPPDDITPTTENTTTAFLPTQPATPPW